MLLFSSDEAFRFAGSRTGRELNTAASLLAARTAVFAALSRSICFSIHPVFVAAHMSPPLKYFPMLEAVDCNGTAIGVCAVRTGVYVFGSVEVAASSLDRQLSINKSLATNDLPTYSVLCYRMHSYGAVTMLCGIFSPARLQVIKSRRHGRDGGNRLHKATTSMLVSLRDTGFIRGDMQGCPV